MKKMRECSVYRCAEEPYRSGLCESHYEESRRKHLRRNAAIDTLHTGVIEGRLPDNQDLHEELIKIRKWWERVCRVLTRNNEDEVLRGETGCASEWCIAIAQEIIDEELAFRLGRAEDPLSREIKRSAWERFENIEMGLMSNGVSRSNS